MEAPHTLQGDGINFDFFNMLWSKSDDCDRNDVGFESSDNCFHGRTGKKENPILRVPDTVIFQFGQPYQWYFTSKNGGADKNKTTILRKRRANLTLAKIKEVFLSKAGKVGDDDVVAYFISSNRGTDTTSDGRASIVGYSSVIKNETACRIEYFNTKMLGESYCPPKRYSMLLHNLTT